MLGAHVHSLGYDVRRDPLTNARAEKKPSDKKALEGPVALGKTPLLLGGGIPQSGTQLQVFRFKFKNEKLAGQEGIKGGRRYDWEEGGWGGGVVGRRGWGVGGEADRGRLSVIYTP